MRWYHGGQPCNIGKMSAKPDKTVLAASEWLPRSYSLIGVEGKLAVVFESGKITEKHVRKDFEQHLRQENPNLRINFFQDLGTAQSWLGED